MTTDIFTLPTFCLSVKVDYIIVGQGIAGSCIALQLIKKGKKVAVFDQPAENHCSRVAAGMFNPFTGSKMTKTWLADEIFPYLFNFYREAEHLTGRKFFFPKPIYRPFISIEEQNEWMGNSLDGHFLNFITSVETNQQFAGVRDTFGGLITANTGFISTNAFLDAVAAYLQRGNYFFSEKFDHELLNIQGTGVQYKEILAGRVIFCEGIKNSENPWFKQVPIKPLKGEIIVIKCDWKEDVILNRGVYMVPSLVNGCEFKVGSTYIRDNCAPGITNSGRTELEEKLKNLIELPYSIEGQQWGIRPVTGDKKPVLGHHPETDRVVIFNGLGSKGVSLAPYFSDLLSHWMEGGALFNKAVNVSRFKLLY